MTETYPYSPDVVKSLYEAPARVWNRDEELENLQLMMEEMANQPKEEYVLS